MTGGYYLRALKSVESYDQHENKWADLPGMINGRYKHGAVSMGNKMFVIGGIGTLNCEIFDSSSRKFTSIKQMRLFNNLKRYTSVVSIGYKILAFTSFINKAKSKLQIYDVHKDHWSLKKNDFIEAKRKISCAKLPLV